MELMVVVGILIVTTAIAVPVLKTASSTWAVRSAVAEITGVIHSTRYQAISNGYQYQIIMNKAAATFQIQNNPTGTAWVNVGQTNPISGTGSQATINQDTTLLFTPGGMVQAPTGALNFNLTVKGTTKTITVTNYGNITVTP